jgi:hypothetical protein
MSAKDRLSKPLHGWDRNRDVPSSRYAATPKSIHVNDVMVMAIDGEPTNVRVLGTEKIGGSPRNIYHLLNLKTGKKLMVKTATHFLARAESGVGVDTPSADDKHGLLMEQYRKHLMAINRTRKGAATRKAKGINVAPPPRKPTRPDRVEFSRVTERHPQPEFHVHVHDRRAHEQEMNDQAKLLKVAASRIGDLEEKLGTAEAVIHSMRADLNGLLIRVEGLENTVVSLTERVVRLEDPHAAMH